MESIVRVQNILKLFYTYFGLKLNCEKSEIFCAGMRKELVEEIKQATGFKSGVLIVRYLGVKLVHAGLLSRTVLP